VLVCGGRDFADRDWLFRVLDELGPSEVIHGAARGADRLAGEWARARGVACREYPADWKGQGRGAGFRRNPDLVVAFPGGRSTADMVAKAGKAEVKVMVEAPGAATQEA
jgi:hypothetical protein